LRDAALPATNTDMPPYRYIFTVTAGRSGQGSLTALLKHHVPGCYPAFEEPGVNRHLPGVLGDFERLFRRRFVETHELLGRGQVLTAFESGDDGYLEKVARRRLQLAHRTLAKHDAHIYFDVSKYFARGLHRGFARLLPSFSLVRLVRDPLLNMRSFLNRDKNFRLDNSLPDARNNLLRLDSSDFAPGEFYLWAWCEMYLRYARLVEDRKVERSVEIRTEDLSDAAKVNAALDALGLAHTPVAARPSANTNLSQGLGETAVRQEDVDLFERFVARLPGDIRRDIAYFSDYDPARLHAS
jgi:hypothetical protein